MALLECVRCSQRVETQELDVRCKRCGAALMLASSWNRPPAPQDLDSLPQGVWRYRSFLPPVPRDGVVSLGEGGTPLLHATRLGRELGLDRLLIKDESRNPTGSFMDRGSTVLVSLAKMQGITECTCETTGNLGASLAAYCAKAGMRARIRIRPGTDSGKLYQMLAYGALLEAHAPRSSRAVVSARSLSVSAGNPYLLEGEKTTCLEIVQDLGWRSPDAMVVPVGTGGHLSVTWRTLLQLKRSGFLSGAPSRLLGVKIAGPEGVYSGPEWMPPAGSFTELEESEPFFMGEAKRAIDLSRGSWLSTSAAKTVRATTLLAKTEGIFAEPASASVIASLEGAVDRGVVRRDDTVVCIITSAGLKDTRAVASLARSARRVARGADSGPLRPNVGETKLTMLRLLEGRTLYGYELWLEIKAGKKMTTASIYQHLVELEGMGLVRRGASTTVRGRQRIPYELTRRGEELLRAEGRFEKAQRRGIV